MSNFAPQSVSRSRYVPLIGAVLFAVFALALAIHPWRSAQAVGSSTIVISQVYGGGGNASSTYKNDFIELFNRGNSAVNLSGWSVQYASAAGTSWQVTNLSAVSLAPGKYYLVQEAAQGGGTTNLPTPDASGAIPMSATAGKVALLNTTTALTTSGCPFSANVIDFVGFGTGTSCSEGTATAAPSNTTAVIRAGGGCTDTDSNSANLAVGAPTPRNTSSAPNPCGGTNQAIAPTCPASVSTTQGTSAFANVSATDSDGTVTAASITSAAVPGITLDSFTPAASVGGTATATLNVANTTLAGTYSVVIQYSNNDSPTPQTASCTVTVTVIGTPNQSTVAISQVYGGGGNASAPFKNDFIEIINRTGSPVSLNGWSVQYAATNGTSWQVTPLTNVSLQPGQYYLVQESSGGAVGANLPAPDTIDTISMAAGAGKVALVNSTTALTGGCPLGGSVIDFVGFGTGTTCFEGAGTTATLSNTTAALRANAGCTDTNSNSADFSAGAPNPRNTSSPANPCVAINQAIVPTCPGSLSTDQGTAASASVSATDVDGRVTSAAITSAAVAGITLDGFTPAGAVGGTATATLNVANTTATGTYNVTIQYSNNDSPTPQTASCTVLVTVNSPPAPFNAAVKISQVYGGGGNSGSTYMNDFIELYNTGATPVDITGWSVQYTGATTAFAAQTTPSPGDPPTPLTTTIPPGSIIQPGHYFLIQESQGTGGTTSNPPPDVTGGIFVGSTAGKVALVASSNVLTGGTAGNCPTDPLIVDFIGYGISPTTASCSETSPTITLTNTTAAIRKNNGCTDTNNNANDFLIDGPIPRNSSSPVHRCGGDPSQPSGVGIATPDYLLPSSNTLLTVNVSPATTPPSTGVAISADLTSIGGAASQQFYDDGTHGDPTAGDNIFSYLQTVGPFITTGVKNIVANITDAQARSATAPITITIQSPTCGVERWAVKTGGDPAAALVDLNPVPTTIANLRTLTPPPSVGPNTPRTAPGETTVYLIRATMTLYKLEGDVDYHIVVQDENGATMVTEIPCPCCVAVGSPFTAGIANARQQFDARFTATTSFQSVSVPVQLTGVGFFDPIHGQTGVAPNGIELHPILDIRFLANTTTTVTSDVNPSQYGNSVMFTSTVASGGPNVPTGTVAFKDGATVISSSALNGSGQASFTTTSLSVGSHSITVSYPGDSNSLASTSTVLTQVVNKADQFITFDPIAGKTYGDADFSVSATASSSLPVSFSIVSGPATIAGSTVHITGAGTVTVRASQAGNGNYSAAPDVDQSFEVVKANQAIVFAPLSDKTYGDSPFTVSATGGGSGNAVTFSASGNCTSGGPNGSTITITGAGSCTVTASQTGNANYNSAPDVSRSFTINKASSTTTVTCPPSETYTGAALTPCSVTVTGVDLSLTPAASYANNTNVGTATASYTYAGDANHDGSSDSKNFEITKASTTTTVTCPASETYTGAALTPCSVTVTGANLSLTPGASYANNTNVGTATASYTYAGDSNHDGSSDSKNFEITKASTTTTVTCPASETYTGAALTPCSVTVTGANLSLTPGASYANNTNVGTATASYTYAGDANHDGSSDSKNFEITKASTTTTVTCPLSATYTGAALTPCSVTVTGANLSLTPGASYANNTNVGTATASYTYAGDANHEGSSDSKNFEITSASTMTTVTCPASETFTGSALTPCSVTVTGANLSLSPAANYANNTNVGTATAGYTYAGDPNHTGSSDSKNFEIMKASSTTTVTCPASETYTGSALTPCTASYSGAGGLTGSLTPIYSNNTNVGTAGANATYDGDANHTGSSGSGSFEISKAASTTTVSVSNATFDGNPHGGTATATGVGGLNQTLTVTYNGRNLTNYGPSTTEPTNAGDYTASATFAGDDNHTGSADSRDFTIDKASSTTTVTCTAGPFVYSGSPITPCTASATGAGSLAQTLTVSYADNVNAGNATASASFGGDDNHTGSSDSRHFAIAKANQLITFGALNDTTFGAANFTINATSSSGLIVSLAVTSGPCTLDSATSPANVHITGAGTCNITGTQAGNSNYNSAPDVSRSFNIAKANQTISFNALPNKVFGDPNFSVSATGGGSGNPITFTAIGNCTVSGSTVHITGAGSCTVIAAQNGNGNYNPAADVSQSFSIAKAPSTTTVSCPSSLTYAGVALTPCSVTVTGASLSLTPAASYANNTNVGTATASYTYAGDSNHFGSSDSKNFQITKANANITITPYNVTYDGNPHAAAGTAKGVQNETLSGLNLSGTTHTNAGSYPTDPWTFTDVTGNYNNASGTVADSIAKATPLFSNLSSPIIDGNTASVTLSGKLTLGSLVPTGSVAITLNGVTHNAAIQPNGSFSSDFSTGSLIPANSPYAVTFAYAGDANFNPANAGSTLTIKAPRKVKQDVLAALMVLRAAATDKKDKDELDDAIEHLNKALNPAFWVDDSHPTEKDGEKVFNEEKNVVKELAELIKHKQSMNLTDAALMDLIARLVQVDRELALISISEETDPQKVAKAMDEIAKGDAERDKDKPDHADNAIDHYKKAWKKT